MDFDRWTHIVARVFSAGAFLLLAAAVVSKVLFVTIGVGIPTGYSPGRLAEFGAILQIFVIPLLLRQIREELRKKGA